MRSICILNGPSSVSSSGLVVRAASSRLFLPCCTDHTNDYFLDMVDQSKVDVPAWTPLAEMHPCDFQSSMLKGCMPSPYQNLTFDFYSEDHRRRIRSIYYAMV